MAVTTQGSFLVSVQQQFESLPARSRRLLLFLLVLLGAAWMGGLWWWTSTDLMAQGEQLEQLQRTLRNLQTLQVEYIRANEQITDAEARLAQLGRQNISSFIETKARENEVRDELRGIERGGSETRGRIRETRYRVTIERAPIARVVGFIHHLETSGFLSTENSKVTSTFVSGERVLSITLDLIAYELVQEN
jgi:hypothetical protein